MDPGLSDSRYERQRVDTSESEYMSEDDFSYDEETDDKEDADWLEVPKRFKASDEHTLRRSTARHSRSITRKGSSSQLTRATAGRGHPPTRSLAKSRSSQSLTGLSSRPSNQRNTGSNSPADFTDTSRLRNSSVRACQNSSPRRDLPRQCFGIGCTRPAANPMTKYCSRKCGLALALRRLEHFLPERRAAWYPEQLPVMDSAADRADRARVKEVRKEQYTIHHRLIELENEHQQLNALIARGRDYKFQITDADAMASAASDEAEAEQAEPVVCVTCSSEINMRHALRHMERCFQKMEGSTFLLSNQKEQSRGTPLFCDFYDTHAKAYCKRLRAVCEHTKEAKYPPDSICGFPLVENVFTSTDRFCCTPRSKCTRHFGWERKKRAKIDVERYRQLSRMDELLQEEARLQRSLAQRAGILGMLLHRTVEETRPSDEDEDAEEVGG
ncbi:unmethylated CpG binding [Sparganum proliferum]